MGAGHIKNSNGEAGKAPWVETRIIKKAFFKGESKARDVKLETVV